MPPPPPPPPPPPHSAASPAAATIGGGKGMPLPDASSCHHCHIHAPISAKDLKRTHPLRSSLSVDPRVDVATVHSEKKNGPLNFRKNVSFLYRKIHKNDAKIAAKHRHQAEAASATLPISVPLPPLRAVDNQPAVVLDSLPPLPPVPMGSHARRRRPVGMAGLQAAVLIGAYALLLVLAVVIGVVLSQDQAGRRGRGRRVNAAVPPRPSFRGAALAPAGPGPIRVARPRFPQENTRISRPRQSAPPPTTPAPPPPTAAPEFFDYDYVYVDDAPQELLPNPVLAPSRPVFTPQPAPRQPVFTQPPRRPAPQPTQRPAPRRPVGTLASIDRDFNLQPEEKIRGRKEPEVKILRSWSHQNADGTFSWGYENTDGSFKNETRGLDCVVTGVYGYIDQDTGEQVSFPYSSGNPCNPDEPDYYYDYDSNTMMVRDSDGQVSSRPGSRPQARRQG